MIRKSLALLLCLALAGCEPPDPAVSQEDVELEITAIKLSKHTHFSFRETGTGYRYAKVSTGKYCSRGKHWLVGDLITLTVVTYQGERGQYKALPSSQARRMCR